MSQHINPTPKQTDLASLNSNLTPVEVPVTWDAGNTAQSYTRLSIFGCVAVLNLSITINTTGGGWNKVGSFSSGYAPKIDVYFILYDSSNTSTTVGIKCYINSNGTIYIMGEHSNDSVRGSGSWIVNH